jgi:hypothetical protein
MTDTVEAIVAVVIIVLLAAGLQVVNRLVPPAPIEVTVHIDTAGTHHDRP